MSFSMQIIYRDFLLTIKHKPDRSNALLVEANVPTGRPSCVRTDSEMNPFPQIPESCPPQHWIYSPTSFYRIPIQPLWSFIPNRAICSITRIPIPEIKCTRQCRVPRRVCITYLMTQNDELRRRPHRIPIFKKLI